MELFISFMFPLAIQGMPSHLNNSLIKSYFRTMPFVTYKSSAGSGKTTTLVSEYLTLALSSPSPDRYRQILAITFTNKAAQEMKSRVIASLEAFSGVHQLKGRELVIFNKVKAATKLEDEELKKRASHTLSHLLHHYSDFSISTIDSFTHRVIRTFAHDLKLPVNFEIDMDNDLLLKRAIDLLMDRVGNDTSLTNALIAFATSKTDENKSWRIEGDLRSYANYLLRDDHSEHIEALRTISMQDILAFRNDLFKQINQQESFWQEKAQYAVQIIDQNQIDPASFYRGNSGIYNNFNRIASGDFSKMEPNSYVTATINDQKWYATKASVADKNTIDSISSELTAVFHEIQQHYNQTAEHYTVSKALLNHLYPLAVLHELELELENYKADNNIMPISEFNRRIAGIVLEEPAPFIYERLGERYTNYLIDEFQDTSISQWHNLLPLMANSLSTGAEDKTNFNMVVGDGKQSIYRWRGGEAEQFVQLPKVLQSEKHPVLQEHQSILHREHVDERLNSNYRSTAEVVSFNNRFFKLLMEDAPELIREVYEDVQQAYNASNTGGYIQAEVITYEDKTELDEAYPDRCISIIRNCLENGYALNDICILTRANKDATKIADKLVNENIAVISNESLLLEKDPKVKLLMALFAWTGNEHHRIFLAQIIVYLNKVTSLGFSLHETLESVADLENPFDLEAFLSRFKLEEICQVLRKRSLYEAAQRIITLLQMEQQPNAYLTAVMEQLFRFSHTKSNHPVDFLNYWNEKKSNLSVNIPEGIDAVQLMTIHKSKGLEFPIVILPYADWTQRKSENNQWINLDEPFSIPTGVISLSEQSVKGTPYESLNEAEKTKSTLDDYNLLYVAFTRAEKQLYILTSKNSKRQAGSPISVPIIDTLAKDVEHWNNEEMIYRYGTFTPQDKKSITKQPRYLQTLSNSDWKKSLKLALTAPWLQKDSGREYGNIVHYVLSIITTKADVTPCLDELLIAGWISPELKQQLSNTLLPLLSHPDIAPLFTNQDKVLTERELVLPEGQLLRPDRVVLRKEQTLIIDFKTGKARSSHQKQVKAYGAVLRQMGYPNVETLLIYTDPIGVEVVE